MQRLFSDNLVLNIAYAQGPVVDGSAEEQDEESAELNPRTPLPGLSIAAAGEEVVEEQEVDCPDGDGAEVVEDGMPYRGEIGGDVDGHTVVGCNRQDEEDDKDL